MSIQRIKQKLINLIPIKRLRRYLSYNYGWFPKSYVDSKVVITAIRKLKIGIDVDIAGGTKICCDGGVEIGSGTIIASDCLFMSANHNYNSKTSVPFDDIGLAQSIKIGKNCWIGANCMFAAGVNVGDGCVIGMGSVVTKSIPKGAIVAGNPAKIIKFRNIETYDKLAKENKTFISQTKGKTKYIQIEGFKEEMKFSSNK